MQQNKPIHPESAIPWLTKTTRLTGGALPVGITGGNFTLAQSYLNKGYDRTQTEAKIKKMFSGNLADEIIYRGGILGRQAAYAMFEK